MRHIVTLLLPRPDIGMVLLALLYCITIIIVVQLNYGWSFDPRIQPGREREKTRRRRDYMRSTISKLSACFFLALPDSPFTPHRRPSVHRGCRCRRLGCLWLVVLVVVVVVVHGDCDAGAGDR